MLFSNIKCLNEIKSTIILYYTQTLRVETFSLAQLLIVYLTIVIKILKWTFWTLPILSRKGVFLELRAGHAPLEKKKYINRRF